MCVFCVGAQKPSNARALALLYLPVLHHGKAVFLTIFVLLDFGCAMTICAFLIFGSLERPARVRAPLAAAKKRPHFEIHLGKSP